MPFVQVYAIFQDSKGFLYTGGYNGLSRFDGKLFTNINSKNGLADNYVNAICEDKKGSIIVGTKKGVSVVVNNKVDKEKINGLAPGTNVLCLEKDKNGDILLGTNSGLFLMKDKDVVKIEGTENNEIYDVLVVDNKIYCASNKGLLIIQNGKLQHLTTENGISNNHINCIAISENKGILALGTVNGLSLYDIKTGKVTSYYIENGLLDNNVSCLLYEPDNSLWIGSQTGLIKFEYKEFNYYNISYDNNSNIIRCAIKDSEGNVWLGTHSGMYRYRDNSFSTLIR
jgi:ligand-binding sensor domain-containing protein